METKKDIFSEKLLHPGQSKLIKRHYSDHFDTVFLSFSPFFKLRNEINQQGQYQKSKKISFEEAQKLVEPFQKMPKPAAAIYFYDNENYPSEEMINKEGYQVSWSEIKEGCNFQSLGDINKALKTSIGAERKQFSRPDLAKTLSDYTWANKIYYPVEGHFEVLSKKLIFNSFRLLNKNKLVVEEENCFKNRELDISSFTDKEFVDEIKFKDYFIYDTEKELLFAIDWDDFFFLICSNKKNVEFLIDTLKFEGFYCNDTTRSSWELSQEEFEERIQFIKQHNEAHSIDRKKPWWKFW